MKIIELSTESRAFLNVLKRQHAEDARRTPGLHLSQIVQDIHRTLYPQDFENLALEGTKRTYFELGNTIEQILADSLAERQGWSKPAPVRHDGVWCSADGYNPRTRTIDEMKACWKSATPADYAGDFKRTGKWDAYVRQVLGYMKAYGATRARLHIVHMNGDWRPPVPWPPKTYILRPTEREIDRNWQTLLTHARDRRWLTSYKHAW